MKKFFIKSKKAFIFSTFLILGLFSFAENFKIKELVNPAYYDELTQKGSIAKYRDDGSTDYLFLPDSKYSEQLNKGKIEKNKKNYPFIYEALYILNKNDLLKSSGSSATTITINDISKICRSVSKMEGMKYFSTTKKKEVVLYKKAYMIENANSSTPIPDQNTGNANGQISYSYQDDSSFGPNKYQLSYFQSDDQMLAQFLLLDVMGLGPFKAIYPKNMINNILIIDCGEDLLLYLCTDLDAQKLPGIKSQIVDSMTSRMEAIYKWFITQF